MSKFERFDDERIDAEDLAEEAGAGAADPGQGVAPDGAPIVYVRSVVAKDLPEDVAQRVAAAGGAQDADARYYAVHDEAGRPLALFGSREMAFAMARSQNMAPVSAH